MGMEQYEKFSIYNFQFLFINPFTSWVFCCPNLKFWDSITFNFFMPFTHLHVHSHYSLLDGLGKIDELLDRAKSFGMDSLALTDHGVLYGAIEFYIKAKERGMKPIIGCEMYLAPNGRLSKNPTMQDRTRYHLILLAKNLTGYKNLMKLVSIAHLEGFYYKPRIDKETLKKYSGGLIASSACMEGEVPALAIGGKFNNALDSAREYEDIFGKGNFYLELMHHPSLPKQEIANKALIEISKKTGIPMVATNDIHYVMPDDDDVQDILLCVQTNRKVHEKDRMSMKGMDLSLKSPEEMLEMFSEVPEAVENTQRVSEMCDLQIPMGEVQLPHFEVPQGYTPESYLRKICEEGLKARYNGDISAEHKRRMEYELSVIEKTGFASYFLIVADFVNWAKNQGIVVGPGRGSAAGSFVSYLANITNIDPIKYSLLFERFLNPERISMPDMDIDFADDRRDEVLDYVRKKYGQDHVSNIITFGTMAARAAIRDAGRASGYPYDYCDKAAKMIPMFSTIKDALNKVSEFREFYSSDSQARKLIDIASRLEGVVRHASMHACGVVITREPVENYSPLQYIIGKSEGTVTQYSSSTKSSFVEKVGLLKMDFLGLKNLTIIQNTLRIVRKTREVDIDIEKIPLDDEKTFKLLQKAETTGVFQLESNGMKRYLKLLKPEKLEDVIAMVALYRPGPMDWIPNFIASKNGEREVNYLHPKLKPILESTYGVAVYQEQVMQIARDLAGFTLGEADVLRKAMGKKIPELIREQRNKFIESAVKNEVGRRLAEKIFDFIEPFAGYGFNRSHAACYALIGYQTAYLKAHFPAEFMAALLTSDQNDIDRVAIEIAECRGMGIEILAPDINESFEDFAVITQTDADPTRTNADANVSASQRSVSVGQRCIRFGLNAIKNVGATVAREIVEERKRGGKYKDFTDFLTRVESKDLNKKSIEALAKVGALSSLEERNKVLKNVDKILSFNKIIHNKSSGAQGSLFSEEFTRPELKLEDVEPAGKSEKLAWEKELLGLYVSDHPASDYDEFFRARALPIGSLNHPLVGTKVCVGGVISKVHKVFLKRGGVMNFVTLEDMSGSMEVLVFPKMLERTAGAWEEGQIVMAEGTLTDKEGVFKVIVDTVKLVGQNDLENFKRVEATRRANGEKAGLTKKIVIFFKNSDFQPALKKVTAVLDKQKAGDSKVLLRVAGDARTIETPYQITAGKELKSEIEKATEGVEVF